MQDRLENKEPKSVMEAAEILAKLDKVSYGIGAVQRGNENGERQLA